MKKEAKEFHNIEAWRLEVEIESLEIALEAAYSRQQADDLRAEIARKNEKLKTILNANQY